MAAGRIESFQPKTKGYGSYYLPCFHSHRHPDSLANKNAPGAGLVSGAQTISKLHRLLFHRNRTHGLADTKKPPSRFRPVQLPVNESRFRFLLFPRHIRFRKFKTENGSILVGSGRYQLHAIRIVEPAPQQQHGRQPPLRKLGIQFFFQDFFIRFFDLIHFQIKTKTEKSKNYYHDA